MSPQETQTLQDFLNQLTQVRGIGKDPQAAAMIAAAVAQQPDAAYLLVQRALLMDQALTTSKAQIASLQAQLQAAQSSAGSAPGFLDSNAWGNAAGSATAVGAGAPVRISPAAPAPAYAPAYAPTPAPQASAPAASPGFFGGGLGSTLGTVAATAAGVAGGAFLFQGIEHLMSGNSGSGLMHQGASNTPTETIENTTVNNYYGADADKEHARNRDDSTNDAAASNDFSDLSNIDVADNSDVDSFDGDNYDDSIV